MSEYNICSSSAVVIAFSMSSHCTSASNIAFAYSITSVQNMPLAKCKAANSDARHFLKLISSSAVILTPYALAISGATLLCRKFLKLKRLWDVQIPIHPYNIWSDQDKTVGPCTEWREDRNYEYHILQRGLFQAGGIFQSFRQPYLEYRIQKIPVIGPKSWWAYWQLEASA